MQACERMMVALETNDSEEAQRLISRTQAYQAAALQNLGQLEKANQLLEASLERAQKLDSREDIAHALIRLGSGAVFGDAADTALLHFEQALEIYEALNDHHGKVWALQGLGWANMNLGQIELTQLYHQRSLPLLRKHGPPNLLAWTLFELGEMARERGDYGEARTYLEDAEEVCEAIGYHFALLSCLLGLGQTAEAVGRYRAAQTYYKQAVDLRDYVGDAGDIAMCLMFLTRVTLALGDGQDAKGYLRELQVFCENSANQITRGCYEYACGELAQRQGRLEAAETHYRQSVEIMRSTRRRVVALLALLSLGQVYRLLGDDLRAEAHFREGLHEAWQRSAKGPALEAISGIAAILARQRKWERALEIVTLVQMHPASSWRAKQQAEELQNELREVPAVERLAASLPRGTTRPLETVIAELQTELV